MATILTDNGRAKILTATPLAPLTLSHIAWGDGAGSIPPVLATRTSLVNELLRVQCSPPTRDTADPTVLSVSGVIPRTFGGATLREVGVFDNTGTLIAFGTVNNESIPTSTNEYGYTYTATMRFKLDNVASVSVVNSDSASFDHRVATFRDSANAHPASSISTIASRTVQDMFSAAKVVSANSVLTVGEDHIISANSTQTLPPISGLAVGSRVTVSKYSSALVTVVCNNIATEQILVGANTGERLSLDSILLDDYCNLILISNGTNWEAYF